MSIKVTEINHVQITVPSSAEEASKHFYGVILDLQEIAKPVSLRNRGGAWYRHGAVELHLSTEDLASDNHASRRHVCLVVADLTEAEEAMREAGVEVIPDRQPIEGWRRFYVRDPGGNRIEIAQRFGDRK
jgi:catechol 2,3-dioxygenase-like lactoylglutathione lyase family enzyme